MSQTTETSHRLQGMTCGRCELSVREEVEELKGVQSAVVDRASGSLIVRGTAKRATRSASPWRRPATPSWTDRSRPT
ncbi:MAG: heavy-metal-associated domain-containing protein [Solirubrobacteraceae bacterium]